MLPAIISAVNKLASPISKTIFDKTDPYTWGDALNVVVCGFAIVFVMLILLVLIIKIFGTVMDNFVNKKKAVTETPPANVSTVPVKAVDTTDDDDELIAVITAAVDAMYDGSGKKPKIKSITKTKTGHRNNWAKAGIFKNTRAF